MEGCKENDVNKNGNDEKDVYNGYNKDKEVDSI